MFSLNDSTGLSLIMWLCLFQLWHHKVEAEYNCSQKTNKTCDECIKDGCTYCTSTKTCLTFDLVNDILHNKCPGQDWKYQQCSVNGKFLIIAIPVTIAVVIVILGWTIYCCCRCECCCRCCGGCLRCTRTICYYCFCCCCCCERDSSRSFTSDARRGLLRGVRNPMTKRAASRIQSATARSFGGMVPKGSFASRAQSTADRRAFWGL